MIHFQHDEYGATLRPSEVKPKLDKFILTWCEKNSITIPDGWYIDKEHNKALNYKMRIIAPQSVPVIGVPHKLFFSHTGVTDQSPQRKTIFYKEPLTLQIVSFVKEKINLGSIEFTHMPEGSDRCLTLSEFIGFCLVYFFKFNTFRMRSSKGFGSFYLDGSSEYRADEHLFCPVYYSIPLSRETQSVSAMMDIIWEVSCMMKSGFNFTFRNSTDYYKGRIFRYFTKNGVGSDKAFIKRYVLTNGHDKKVESEEHIEYSSYVFSRAMLGLAQNYQFRSGMTTSRSGHVEIKGSEIARFKSPVTFKAEPAEILIIPSEIPKKMFGAEFKLNNKIISTPNRKEFDLITFLDYFKDEFNNDNRNNRAQNEILGFSGSFVKYANKNPRILRIEKK